MAVVLVLAPVIFGVVTVLGAVLNSARLPGFVFVLFVSAGVVAELLGWLPEILSDANEARAQQFFSTCAQVIGALLVALAVEVKLSPPTGKAASRVQMTGVLSIALGVLAALVALVPDLLGTQMLNLALIAVIGSVMASITTIVILARPDELNAIEAMTEAPSLSALTKLI